MLIIKQKQDKNMKKILLITLIFCGFLANAQFNIEGLKIKGYESVETGKDLIIKSDTISSTTQMNLNDTTIVTLNYLDSVGSGLLDNKIDYIQQYYTIDSLVNSQSSQHEGYIYQVDSIFYKYDGTATGSIDDYTAFGSGSSSGGEPWANAFVGKVEITTNPTTVIFPRELTDNYQIITDIYYIDYVGDKEIRVSNAVYDYTESTTGFSFYVDTIAGYCEYIAVDTVNILATGGILWGSIEGIIGNQADLLQLISDSLSSYTYTETDPIYSASEAFNITATDITNLGNLSGVNTGDQDLSGYATTTALTTHTSNLDIHFEQSEIDITASQVSDFDTEVSNNTDVLANTAKVTNATHTNEVTGSTALTIANDVVDYDNVAATLKGIITDNDGSYDMSAAGIFESAISSTTTLTFTSIQANKSLMIVLTVSSSATISFDSGIDEDWIQGEINGDGIYAINVLATGSTLSDLLITIIPKQ